jgi:hypothetical protein
MCLHIGLRSLIQASQPRMVIGAGSLGFLSLGADILDVSLPAPRLKPVVGKADLGAGETCAVGRVDLDGLQQILRCDPFLHGLFDLGKAGRFAPQSVGRIGWQNFLSFFIRRHLALARRWFMDSYRMVWGPWWPRYPGHSGPPVSISGSSVESSASTLARLIR